ncbi:MAG TPA: hypothetical protein VK403_09220 [Allosphingosinicella sp.]|nr:hypothetical protein [Allosphingosinicella sp.]
MTTEVIIINRMGVVMATDSAVTISTPAGSKVYDSGEKLFELDCSRPIGILINGNMHFLGIPWELIVKDFRDKHRKQEPAADAGTPEEARAAEAQPSEGAAAGMAAYYCPAEVVSGLRASPMIIEAFFGFINSIAALLPADPVDGDGQGQDGEQEYVRERAAEEFKDIVSSLAASGEASEKNVADTIVEEAQRRAAEYDECPADFSRRISRSDVLERHGSAIDAVIDESFHSLPRGDPFRRALRQLIVSALLSQQTSRLATGLAVAGYGKRHGPASAANGKNDMFPSLVVGEVDGAVCGQLRFFMTDSYQVDASNHGTIVSFAQIDVVERLLTGVDRPFIDRTEAFIEEHFAKIGAQLTAALDKERERLAPILEQHGTELRPIGSLPQRFASETVKEWRESASAIRSNFRSKFHGMIGVMPKREMIELAEALVNITAIERKASPDQSTVGGPIDVALITKHEEFLWIKRKFFFEARYNPRYYARRFGLSPQFGDEQ